MGLFTKKKPAPVTPDEERLSLDAYLSVLNYAGHQYLAGQSYTSWHREEPLAGYQAVVSGIYQSNGIVFACVAARQLVFAEARFKFRSYDRGRAGDLFGTPALSVLERPWPNGTTGELLARMEQDASLAGNSFWVRRGDRLVRLRPDWVTIVAGTDDEPDADDVDADLLGYAYTPGGPGSGRVRFFLADEVAHYSPVPDPLVRYRGMSWLTPVVREVMADDAMTEHRQMFFRNGATPNMVLKIPERLAHEQAQQIIASVRQGHEGVARAYRTMVLSGGVDLEVVGRDFAQVDFKVVQGAGETRIAAAAGVPPVIVGLSEGLEAATYSNYAQARRRFADGTIRPLWRMAAASLARLVDVPDGAELWFDDHDVAFLREDVGDQATIVQTQAASIRQLIDAGFRPDDAVAAVTGGDLRRLTGAHTGLYSVQLQPAGADTAPVSGVA